MDSVPTGGWFKESWAFPKCGTFKVLYIRQQNRKFTHTHTQYEFIRVYVNITLLLRSDVDHLNWPGAAPKSPPLCLLAARDGAKPSNFWIFCRMDIVHRMYRKMNEHSV